MNSSMQTTRRLAVLFFSLILAGFLGCAGSEQKESTGEFIDDAAITAKVKAAIFKDPELKVTRINVDTFKGQVQLSGFVASEAERRRAEEVARSVDGVKAVRNDLRLRSA
jgi:osmotically-inducible protein OsmY